MEEILMIINIAVCMFGSRMDLSKIHSIESYITSIFNEKYQVAFFNNFTHADYLKNLFSVCYQKQKYEFENNIIFEGCIALNMDHAAVVDNLLIAEKDIKFFQKLDVNTLYFLSGGNRNNKTRIDMTGFFANSFVFDTVCNFPIIDITVSRDRNEAIPNEIEEKFYWFAKSLKIKTKCINYENSSLFKRTTENN
jgi:hypothetical protein